MQCGTVCLPGRPLCGIMRPMKDDAIELSIVMPCLNEAETLASCIRKAQGFLARTGIRGEIIVGDNGSTDASADVARSLGARVVSVDQKGYGHALMGAIHEARADFVIMGDADDSYDFGALDSYVEKLGEGYDLVMGNRFKGGIAPDAMPALHRYFGNPVLTALGRMFFNSPCGDIQCGLCGFRKSSLLALDLRATGMEFASEMVVKAALPRRPDCGGPDDARTRWASRPPHMRSWREGWRNLRFFLLYSPRWLFLIPGLLLMLVGAAVGLWLMPGTRWIGGVGRSCSPPVKGCCRRTRGSIASFAT